MGKIDSFKNFVKDNPKLLKYVKNNEMTWQQFYEMYDIYGEDSDVWDDYREDKKNIKPTNQINNTTSIGELFNIFKGINLDTVQEGIGSIQRVVEMLGDLTTSSSNTKTPEYKPRPLYKHFDD